MRELVVISGKGGTGKTSVVAAFAALADNAVVADCDVDAADLHLVLTPTVLREEEFSGGFRARIAPQRCTSCGRCEDLCRFGAVVRGEPVAEGGRPSFRVDPIACEGCGVCERFCPAGAVEFGPVVNGRWFVSETRFGPMVHAQLGVAGENSGKLVTLVRREARRIAQQRRRNLVLIDGPPGIGCPVIASIAAADVVLVVAEPTLSGLHDLARAAELVRHFGIRGLVCVNKWDLNRSLAERIEAQAGRWDLATTGRIRYDRAVTDAQVHRQSVVEFADNGAAADVRAVWAQVLAAVAGAEGL